MRRISFFRTLILPFVAAFLLSGCASKETNPDQGMTTEPIFATKGEVLPFQVDQDLAKAKVVFPKQVANKAWTSLYYSPTNALVNFAMEENPSFAFAKDVGTFGKGGMSIAPLVDKEKIYVLDNRGTLRLFSLRDGHLLFAQDLTKLTDSSSQEEVVFASHKKREALQSDVFGGMALGAHALYLTMRSGKILALWQESETASFQVLWSHDVGQALAEPLLLYRDKLFFQTAANELIALDSQSGEQIFVHHGVRQQIMTGVPSVVGVAGQSVIVTYPSGEVFSLNITNGKPNWSYDIAAQSNSGALLNEVSAVAASPVIHGGKVFILGQRGPFTALNLLTGKPLWSLDFEGQETPTLAGDYLFVTGEDGSIAAIHQETGHVKWIKSFFSFRPHRKQKAIKLGGAVVAAGRVYTVSSDGFLLVLDGNTGELLHREDIQRGSFIRPVIAEKTLLLLAPNGDLLALR